MSNTYTKIYIHLVFAVKNRENKIKESFRIELEKYITGVIRNRKHKLLAIYCMPDHAHILVGLNPDQSISNLVRDIKANSSKFINEKRFLNQKFNWQYGYGAFSYSRSHLDNVIKYINNQPVHHKKRTFKEEYLDILKKFEIKYDDKYLFEWYE